MTHILLLAAVLCRSLTGSPASNQGAPSPQLWKDVPSLAELVEARAAEERGLDSVYAHYRVLTRSLDMTTGIPDNIMLEPQEDQATSEWDVHWAKKGRFIYWEYQRASTPNEHTVAWYDGQTWKTYLPRSRTGTIQARPPELTTAFPSNCYSQIDNRPVSELLRSLPSVIARDPRYEDSPCYRIELVDLESYPPLRYMVVLDSQAKWRPRRVYVSQDDLLISDYELKAVSTLANGAELPTFYRLIKFRYKAHNHFPVVESYFEWEVHAIEHSCDSDKIALARDLEFPVGTEVYNDFSKQTYIVGQSIDAVFDSWLEGSTIPIIPDVPTGHALLELAGVNQAEGQNQDVSTIDMSQALDKRCGSLALYGLLRRLGSSGGVGGRERASYETVVAECGDSGLEMAVHEVVRVAGVLGLSLVPTQIHDKSLPDSAMPFIAVTGTESGRYHYLVADPFTRGEQKYWRIIDFPQGLKEVPAGTTWHEWTGIALCLETDPLLTVSAGLHAKQVAWRRVIGTALFAAGLGLVAWRVIRRRRRSLPQASGFSRGTIAVVCVCPLLVESCDVSASPAYSVGAETKLERNLRFEPATLDFGEVYARRSTDRRVVLINESSEVITITEVRTTCGCTATDLLPGATLGPKEVRGVTVSMIVNSSIGGSGRVDVRANSAIGSRMAQLQVSSRVIGEFNLEPPRLVFERTGVGVERIVKVHYVMGSEEEDAEVGKIVTSSDKLDVSSVGSEVRMVAGGRIFTNTYRVTIKSPIETAESKYLITFHLMKPRIMEAALSIEVVE